MTWLVYLPFGRIIKETIAITGYRIGYRIITRTRLEAAARIVIVLLVLAVDNVVRR